MTQLSHFTCANGQRIAFRLLDGEGPTLVFLPGYMSDMSGGKASALFAWAQANGRACLLFDYSGCGESEGGFADGTLSRWRDEAAELVRAVTSGPVVLVGSSMGGWLMLLLAGVLGPRAAGLIGVAAAPDFTEWGRTDADKARLAAGETVFDPNPYGPEPTPMQPAFFADGHGNLLLRGEISLGCPVRLIHGQRDSDVPWEVSLRLAGALGSPDVHLTLVKDGDHRLSREQDIALLLRPVATI
ncbi:MAG: alpha/beta fold hydrolase [Tsuneonella sp.]